MNPCISVTMIAERVIMKIRDGNAVKTVEMDETQATRLIGALIQITRAVQDGYSVAPGFSELLMTLPD